MGGGASAPAEPSASSENQALQAENEKLRRQLAEISAQLRRTTMAASEAQAAAAAVAPPGGGGLGKTGRVSRPTQKNQERRGEVSAEVRRVDALVANYQKVGVPKPDAVRALISQAVEQSLLFNSMGNEEKSECVDAFQGQQFDTGHEVITQGAKGDDFYIVAEGKLEVLVKPKGGKRATSKGFLGPGHSFGELALLYNTPRAATIVARAPVSLWVLTRELFTTISTYFKHQRLLKYEKFLQKADLFKTMPHEKLMRVAEALEAEQHEAGHPIILQGERGDHFYLIEKGTVRYEKEEDGAKRELGTDGPGGFFGERALMDDTDEREASVYAVTDVTLLCMERAMFRQLMKGLEQHLMSQEEKESALRDATRIGEKFRKEVSLADLEIMRTLGEGAFGRVRLVRLASDPGTMFALKYLAKQNIVDNASQEHVINERNIMMMVDCPFVLKLHNTYQDSRYLYFLVELIRGGELFTLLRDLIRVSEKMARFYAAGVVQGFEHLHERNIIDRDLKPENLLRRREGYIKIVDLGLSKVVPDRTWTLCGTPEYLAPETIVNKGHDRAVDNWALGVLIFEMVVGDVPFEGDNTMGTYNAILKGQVSYPQHLSRSCSGIIGAMLQQNSTRRLGYMAGKYSDVRRHHWYVGFDWKSFNAMKMPAPHKPPMNGDSDLSNYDQYDEISVDSFPKCDWSPEGFGDVLD